jgi:agmatine/peptidylarginine deiminase
MIRFCAEWEKQTAVLMAWPHATGDFSEYLEVVEETYSIIADTITQFQRLLIVCRDEAHQHHIQQRVERHRDIDFIHAPVNDIWVRDTAFLSVKRWSISVSEFYF